MLKKLIATAAMTACAAGYVFAQAERATFVLTDGERKSGTLAAHGSNHENLINGYLNLAQQNAQDLTFPKSQVAVIDFAGGQPSAAELQALPGGDGDVLALRAGATQHGQLVNIVNGDTVIWRNTSGHQQQYAVNDVSRIYLNPQAAMRAYNYTPTGQAVGTAGQATPAAPGTVRIQANQPWTATTVVVKKGDRLTFNATGQIQYGQSAGMTADPGGNPALNGAGYPVPTLPVGALIGKVGFGTPFAIGSNTQPITMPADGLLTLGINDNQFNDNSGAFVVTVKKVG